MDQRRGLQDLSHGRGSRVEGTGSLSPASFGGREVPRGVRRAAVSEGRPAKEGKVLGAAQRQNGGEEEVENLGGVQQ